MKATAARPEHPPAAAERFFRPSPNHKGDWPITGCVWFDMDQVDGGNPEILDLTRRMTRLTLWALNGMLVDSDGSELEKSDLRLIQEVAWIADMCIAAAGERYLDDDGQERRPPIGSVATKAGGAA